MELWPECERELVVGEEYDKWAQGHFCPSTMFISPIELKINILMSMVSISK